MPARCRSTFAGYRRQRHRPHSVREVPDPGISDRVLVRGDHFDDFRRPWLLLEFVLEFPVPENLFHKNVISARSRISSEKRNGMRSPIPGQPCVPPSRDVLSPTVEMGLGKDLIQLSMVRHSIGFSLLT